MKKFFFIAPVFVLIVLFFNSASNAQDRLTGKSFATRSVVMAQHGMACTSQPLATEAAINILKKGGNAIDAAIAANAVLGVTDPEMNGIGGDLFAIVYDAKTKKLYGLNASGRSPYNLTLDILKQNGKEFIPVSGPLPVSVPGCVDGWFRLQSSPTREAAQPVSAPRRAAASVASAALRQARSWPRSRTSESVLPDPPCRSAGL